MNSTYLWCCFASKAFHVNDVVRVVAVIIVVFLSDCSMLSVPVVCLYIAPMAMSAQASQDLQERSSTASLQACCNELCRQIWTTCFN